MRIALILCLLITAPVVGCGMPPVNPDVVDSGPSTVDVLGSDTAVATDVQSDVPQSDASAPCNAISLDFVAVRTMTTGTGSIPTAAGGTITEGTYELASMTMYDPPG